MLVERGKPLRLFDEQNVISGCLGRTVEAGSLSIFWNRRTGSIADANIGNLNGVALRKCVNLKYGGLCITIGRISTVSRKTRTKI